MFTPLVLAASTSFAAIGIWVAGAAATSVVRLGIYNADINGTPTTLVLDAGTVDVSTTGAKQITISRTLAAGNYCLALVAQTAASGSITYVGTPFAQQHANTMSAYTNAIGYSQSSVTGALPSTVGTLIQPNVVSGCLYGAVKLKVA
jgi:hypothetical protein